MSLARLAEDECPLISPRSLLIRPKSGENENGSAENYSYTYGRSTGSRKQPFGVNSYKLNNVSRTQAETAQIGTVNYGGAQGIAVSCPSRICWS